MILVRISLLTLAAALLLFIPNSFSQDEEEVVRVDSSIVVLNATVRDAQSKPVFGLQQKHFRIFEDGVEQTVEAFDAQEAAFAAVILFDTSGSMRERISLARSATINFLDGLRVADMTSIYRFDAKVALVQPFSDSRDVSDKVFDLKAEGMTVLNDAIFQAALELGKREEKRKAIVVLSDGADTMSRNSAEKALKAALSANATIYTVDMSSMEDGGRERMQNQGILRNFAEKTGGFFIPTLNGIALRDALKNIVDELRTQYTLSYQPKNTKADGKWHAIELRISRPNLLIRTRKGYNAPKEKR